MSSRKKRNDPGEALVNNSEEALRCPEGKTLLGPCKEAGYFDSSRDFFVRQRSKMPRAGDENTITEGCLDDEGRRLQTLEGLYEGRKADLVK